MKFAPVCLLALICVFAQAQYPGSQPVPKNLKKGFDNIKIDDAKKILTFLATQCDGRGTGQPGFAKAADFVAAQFKAIGLKPVGDNGSYFQNVPFYKYTVEPGQSFLATEDGSVKVIGAGNIAFGRLGADTDKTSNVVFVKESGADAKLDNADVLDGKIVIVVGQTASSAFRRQLRSSLATAVVYVADVVPTNVGSVSRTQGRGSSSASSLTISKSAAQRLVTAVGPDPSVLMPAMEGKAEAIPGTGKLHLVTKGIETTFGVPNVVGYIPGSDPKLKAELIGIGGHLDHLGKTGEVVYPGADDDGSGSTAVIEIAKAIKASGIKPKRGILFMTFCGEEMGLIGSGYYSDHPIFPHDNMVAELQMDMVGRDSDGVQNGDAKRVDVKADNIDTIRLVGSKRISTDLDKAVQENNKYINFRFKWDAEDVYTRSDHYNFAKHGIPIAFLFDGFHPDYHQPTDTVDKIDWVKLTNAAKLYYLVGLDLANRADRPKKDVPQTGN